MVIKTYEDGTEFTTTHLAVAMVAGAVIGTAAFLLKEKYDKFALKRYMKKHSWSAESIERI
jgi:hypothetical protein